MHRKEADQSIKTCEKPVALDAMTKSLSRELAGRNTPINNVAPGFTDTGMVESLSASIRENLLAKIPMGRMGRPGEVAEVIAFLACRGTYINGSFIHVNGGMYGG